MPRNYRQYKKLFPGAWFVIPGGIFLIFFAFRTFGLSKLDDARLNTQLIQSIRNERLALITEEELRHSVEGDAASERAQEKIEALMDDAISIRAVRISQPMLKFGMNDEVICEVKYRVLDEPEQLGYFRAFWSPVIGYTTADRVSSRLFWMTLFF